MHVPLKTKLAHDSAYQFTLYVTLLSCLIILIELTFLQTIFAYQRGTIILVNTVSVFLIAFFALHWLKRKIYHPLQNLADDLESFKINPLDTTWKPECVNNDQIDELKRITTAIDRITVDFKESYQNIVISEQNIRHLLDSAVIGLALWRLEGSFILVNSAFAQITGYSVAEILKLNYWNLVVREEGVIDQSQLGILVRGERYGPHERKYRHQDGY
ncbi:MAG: hypothetical protein BWK79_08010, partial [Beggiatoa sp. IS2]